MVPQSQHANNTTLLAPNEPPGTLPDLDSSTWGGGNRSRGEKGSVSLHEHPPGSTSGAAQLLDKERLWRCRWPQHQAARIHGKEFSFPQAGSESTPLSCCVPCVLRTILHQVMGTTAPRPFLCRAPVVPPAGCPRAFQHH